MWIDIILAISCAACGGMCGWVSHAVGLASSANPKTRRESGDGDGWNELDDDDEGVLEARSLTKIAETLLAHTQNMSDEVDHHQKTVGSINDSLSAAEDISPEWIRQTIQKMVEANQTMQSQLNTAQEHIHQQTLQLESAEQRAQTDALTLIPNRRAFDKYIAGRHAIGPWRSAKDPHAGVLALLDVDHFKKFNDEHGHLAGDDVLRAVAGLLHRRLQKYGVVARYGGEEFAILLKDHSLESASELVEQVRREISQHAIEFEGQTLHVTASIGICHLAEGQSVQRWIELADEGLYESKSAGRDCMFAITKTERYRVGPAETPATKTAGPKNGGSKNGGLQKSKLDDDTSRQSADDDTDAGGEADVQPSPLSYLPDRHAIEATFEEIRVRSSDLELSLMVLRYPSKSTEDQIKSLLPVVRSSLRNVDELGCLDDQTLMVLMPSVQQSAAETRGKQIIEAAAASEITKDLDLKLGVANLEAGEDFDELLDAVLGQIDG